MHASAVWRLLVPVVLSACLGGCIQFKQLDPATSPSADDAIVVLGVSPRSRLSLMAGEVKDGQWHCTGLYNVANVWSADGFMVVKLPPRTGNKSYAVATIFPAGLGVEGFTAGKGTAVPVFRATRGAVTFVGAIKIHSRGRNYWIQTDASVTRSSAEAFLATRYPALAANVAEGGVELLISDGGCL
jgi:hypothetical protein